MITVSLKYKWYCSNDRIIKKETLSSYAIANSRRERER